MAEKGGEPLGSMGNDTALPVLSQKDQSFFDYFKQLFAQVTNPPIDPIREALVTSLISFIGPKPNLLDVNNVNPPRRIEIAQPILVEKDMAKLHAIADYTAGKFRSRVVDITYPVAWGSAGVEARLAGLCAQAVDAVKQGFNILIVSDRAVSRERVAIPVLLAVSALHKHLIAEGLRTDVGLVVDSGAVVETHDVALLMGYGAEAVHPFLALATLRAGAALRGKSAEEAVANYVSALGKGLTKVMAKMGISALMSYRGACIFEAVGLKSDFVDRYFHGTASRVEGIGLFEVMQEAVSKHQHIAGFQIRCNVLCIHCSLCLIVGKNHNDIRPFSGFCGGENLQTLSLCLCFGFGTFIQTDNDVASGFLQVQCMGVTLASVTDNGDLLSVQYAQITIGFIINLVVFVTAHL